MQDVPQQPAQAPQGEAGVPAPATPKTTPASAGAMSDQQPAATTGSTIKLDQLVNLGIEKGASDIHFREGGRVALRVGGKIIFIENVDVLSKEDTEAMVNEMMTNDDDKERLETDRGVDFAFTSSTGVNFRVNVFYQQGKLAGVMRMISKHVMTLEELGVPEVMKNFLGVREGLILVVGTAGSGKSTTVQSMLGHINDNYVKHILTIENPIEHVFEGNQSMFTQREIGKDTLGVDTALEGAVREDANVVMVDEIRDFETFDKVLDLVETGHLVIASMLTRDVPQTIERMINMYPQDLRLQAQERVATNLTAILAQDLVERQDQPGLVAVFELMFMNDNMRQIIKRGNFVQIRTGIQSSVQEGMITMDNYAMQLAERGMITQEQVNEFIQRSE